MLPQLLQPLIQQIMSYEKKANIFETEHFQHLYRICGSNVKVCRPFVFALILYCIGYTAVKLIFAIAIKQFFLAFGNTNIKLFLQCGYKWRTGDE